MGSGGGIGLGPKISVVPKQLLDFLVIIERTDRNIARN